MNTKELLKDFEKNFPLIDPDLDLNPSYESLEKEFFWYLDHKGKLSTYCANNAIIKAFQQDMFYIVEKELWKNEKIKIQLIENRCKYLCKNPEELTTYDILSGFKKSGIYYGYSGFNPLLAKWFFEQYKTKICYDPCGGWGHRMLGSTEIDKYIYNDLSKTVAENVLDIKNTFDFFNVEVHSNDARTFIPDDDFDTMFTCPPYFNLELYECGEFKDIDDYNDFIDCLFDTFNKKESCKIFGLVIREDLIGKHTDYAEKITLKQHKASHLMKNKKKKFEEYLYIYKKE